MQRRLLLRLPRLCADVEPEAEAGHEAGLVAVLGQGARARASESPRNLTDYGHLPSVGVGFSDVFDNGVDEAVLLVVDSAVERVVRFVHLEVLLPLLSSIQVEYLRDKVVAVHDRKLGVGVRAVGTGHHVKLVAEASSE